MKYLTVNSRVIAPILIVGCFAAVMLAWAGNVAQASAPNPQARAEVIRPVRSLWPAEGITCTLDYTTTSTTWAAKSLAEANSDPTRSQVGTIDDLSLVPDGYGPYSTPRQFASFDHWFRLDNAVVGASYTLEADPRYTSNYNLGIIVYDYTGAVTVTSDVDSSTYGASVEFVPTRVGPYYFKIFQITGSCKGGVYDLTLTRVNPTSTPTNTPTASSTPTPTSSPTATPVSPNYPDPFDNPPRANDTITGAITRNLSLVSNSYTGLTLCNQASCAANVANDDNDWYILNAVAGFRYTVNAASSGVYPVLNLEIVHPNQSTIVAQVFNSNSPSLSWDVSTAGAYYIHVWRAAGSLTSGSYSLSWSSPAPTITPTPGSTPTETPVPGADAFEPNYDFDHAAGIGLNVKYTGINFVPLPGQTMNNDFFKVRIKSGMLVTCETLDLSSGTDTNMILYSEPAVNACRNRPIDQCEGWGNDDVNRAAGELRSRVTISTYWDGFLYILVGQGFAVPNQQAAQYNYALQCTTGNVPGATDTPGPTPTANSVLVLPSTPVPPTPVPLPPTPTFTPIPLPPISVRALPSPTPAGPVQQMITADLQVYYDANENGVADAGEGVVGLPARVYDATTGALLAQGFTNETGHAIFTVAAPGSIRVVVPYLGFEATVNPGGAAIPVLINPRELPDHIP